MKIEKILSDLVKYNTVNDKDNKKIIDYLENYLSKLGFTLEYKNKCLVMSIGKDPVLSFVGHTDVVAVSNTWDSNPFRLKVVGNKLIARGVSDMKGGIAAFLYSLKELNLKELKRGIRVCFTYDEEKEFKGIRELLNKKIDFGEYSIIGEPTNNIPCIGSKGLLEYEIIFNSKALHSSLLAKEMGSNEQAILFLNDILKLNKQFKNNNYKEFDVPFNTINVGAINGGTSICTISDSTKVLLGFRITKNALDIKYIKDYINNCLKDYSKTQIKILNEIKPFYNRKKDINFYERICLKESKPFFGVSEASFLNNKRVIIGPGPVTAHEDNEFIYKTSLMETVKIYQKIINELCMKGDNYDNSKC